QALAGPWLPAAYDPVAVGEVSDVKIERETRALVVPNVGGLATGSRYQITSDIPELSVSGLDQPFTYDRARFADYLQLPQVPGVIRSLAQRIAGDKTTPYEKALALQDYLRTFTYNENVASDFHHSFKNLVEFLTKSKQGYCEQFAASMAVMARVLGIPSRVAIGFGFGEKVGNQYRITTHEAHAWVEVFFPGSGWVAFEPTPRAGVTALPPYAAPGAATPSSTPSDQPTASSAPSSRPKSNTGDVPNVQVGGSTAQHGRPAWVFVAVIAATAAGIVVLAIVLALFLPSVLRRRARGARSAAAIQYVEFLIWCEGAGLGRHQAETPSEHAARLRADLDDVAEPLDRLVALVEDALWAPDQDVDAGEIGRAVRDARDALKATLSRRSKLLAAAGWGRWSVAA
ncbi:MAG TPA: transglutaminase domain-containing protein, partial [Actinomycetota bacterium]|nr:transglutaminase domain-containing protein [Actinomycetota bacterium]